jgi:hypothetical protein
MTSGQLVPSKEGLEVRRRSAQLLFALHHPLRLSPTGRQSCFIEGRRKGTYIASDVEYSDHDESLASTETVIS